MGNKGGGHGQRETKGGEHGNGKQRGRAQARETKRAHGRAWAMGNKESPWETKLGETKGEGVGMGNKGGGHGKQRKGNKTQGNKWGRAWERETKGKGTGGHGQRETKRAHGRAWAIGSKGGGHGQRETKGEGTGTGNKGGGHRHGKQREPTGGHGQRETKGEGMGNGKQRGRAREWETKGAVSTPPKRSWVVSGGDVALVAEKRSHEIKYGKDICSFLDGQGACQLLRYFMAVP